VLSIAGSDSGGGAGIQADLKAFARCGVHGMTVVTAITAQNTVRVDAVEIVSPEMIYAQMKSVVEDIGVDAVKIGMLGDVATITAVAGALELLEPGVPIVLDPVMISESGAELLPREARAALIKIMLPLATVITPNLHEARALVDEAKVSVNNQSPVEELSPEQLAWELFTFGPKIVIVTGGHTENKDDFFFDGENISVISGTRYPVNAGHGSGCTHSSVLAAQLALGCNFLEAATRAKEIAGDAVRDGLISIGEGPGPVNVLGQVIRFGRRDQVAK
jgi:hydroxymethylpyrimidine/phosphomethylpyrimidine kinase